MRKLNLLRSGLSIALVSLLAQPQIASADAKHGGDLFESQKCISCHSLAGKKGKMVKLGGKLDGVGTKHNVDWFKSYLVKPDSKIPDAKMPAVELPATDIADLADYLVTLK